MAGVKREAILPEAGPDNAHKEPRELGILKGAVENTNEAFVTIDEDHTVIFFNKAAEAMFGYSRQEVIGRDLGIILGPRCRENHRQAVARFLKTRNPRLIGHESEFIANRKNGETFPALISFSVAEIEGRLFFTGIVRDVTETKALQERIARSERLAGLGQVVAEITHEIKNPLVMIGGFARQLMGTARDDETLTKLNLIAEEVQRLESLLGELRDLYARRDLVIGKLDVNDLLREIYSLASDDCQAKDIRVNLDTQTGPAFVQGDRSRLKQVFLNLVKNGIEAMAKGGNLSIQSTLFEDKVEIAISDNGPGISEALKEKLFTPFFTTKKQGTGLGLCLSKRIIEDHPEGSITLTSQEKKGTVVRITLGLANCKKDKGSPRKKT